MHHVVSRLFIKIDGVPLEIDTIRMSVKNIDRRITLEGEYSEPGDAPAEVFIVKNEKPHQQVTALFDLYIFHLPEKHLKLNWCFMPGTGRKEQS